MTKKMVKYFLLLAVALPSISFAAPQDKPQDNQKEIEYSGPQIMSKLDEIYQKIKKEDIKDNPLAPTQFASFAFTLNEFASYSKVEKETKIRREWFAKLANLMKAMVGCRTQLKIARMNKDREQYVKAKVEYDKYFKSFEETYKNPPKIKDPVR